MLDGQKQYSMNTSSVIKKMWNRAYYFYNDIMNIKNFDSNLLKIDKKSYKNIGVYNIGYIITIKKIDACENINSVNLLYLRFTHANGYIEEKGVN